MKFSYFLFFLGSLVLATTDIYVSVSQDSIFVGDKTQLTVTAKNTTIESVEFPELDVDNENITLSLLSKNTNSMKLSLQFWKEGEHKFPSIKLNITHTDSSSEVYLTDVIEFKISQRAEGRDETLRESKLNKTLRLPFTIWQVFLISLVLIMIILINLIFSKKYHLNKELFTIQNMNILSKALNKLDSINLPNEMTNRELEKFYISLCMNIKEYLEDTFFFNATKMTTDEILTHLEINNIPHDELKILLNEADLCKFAKKQYGITKLLEVKKAAKSVLTELDKENFNLA
ncbi:MAG: hypothetical protein HN820_04480 [Candidatus Marinimicrobia bacterium]|nr:hypothetical protein [Candidatus Neomarinimicrobiota bacterium]